MSGTAVFRAVRSSRRLSTTHIGATHAIPKVEQHRHLEGAISPTTVLEEARRHGVWLPHGPDGEMTHSDACALEGITPHMLTTTPLADLAKVLKVFEHVQSVLCDMDSFYRIAREAVLTASAEGIRALELRYAPSFSAMGHGHDFTDIHRAIVSGVTDAQSELGDERIGVGLIGIAVGAMGEDEMAKTVDFILDNQDTFIGFDMAGDETDPRKWATQFRRIHDAGIPITCHASECATVKSSWNAVHAVEDLGACRIGHGIQAINDPEAIARLRDAGAMLELSVTSNWVTSSSSTIALHPARAIWEQGIPVSVNTDDPCLFAIDARSEWELWHTALGFSVPELESLSVVALDRSFLPLDERERVYTTFFAGSASGRYPPTLAEAVTHAEEVHRAAMVAAEARS